MSWRQASYRPNDAISPQYTNELLGQREGVQLYLPFQSVFPGKSKQCDEQSKVPDKTFFYFVIDDFKK
jgi:hypothetical protein